MKKKLVPVVKQEHEKEVPVVVLAEAIKAISEGMKKRRQRSTAGTRISASP